jgi:Kef-type K+ transport system membrane component KefB
MNELSWVPSWPSQFSLLAAGAVMLIAGSLAARLVSSTTRIPEISAFLLCGFLLGPSGLSLISSDSVAGLVALADLALGLVLFELGRRVDPVWLLRERWALITALAQGVLVFVGLFAMLSTLNVPAVVALLAAALGCASSPAIGLRTIQESRAEGQVTERSLHSLAVQCLLAICLYAIGLQYLHLSQHAHWFVTLAHPVYLLIGSAAAGLLASGVIRLVSRFLGKRRELQLLLTLSFIALLVEANELLRLSPMVSLLVFGIASRGYGLKQELQDPASSFTSYVVFAFLFIYLGTTLRLSFGTQELLLGLAIVTCRGALLLLPSVLLARQNGLSIRQGALLAGVLFPMSSLSILLVSHAGSFYPEFGETLANLVGSALLITYVLGPLVSWWSIRVSGEAKTDA